MISARAISRVMLATFVLSTGLMLAGCEDTKLMEMFDGKKKLPGDRRPVFPEGVPGVQQGVPPELMKGYRSPEQLSQTPADQTMAAAPASDAAPPAPARPQVSAAAASPAAETEGRGISVGARAAGQPEPPKPKRVAKPRPKPQAQPVADAPPPPQQQQQPVSQAQSRWPTPQQETQQQEAAPAPGTTRPWPGSAPAAPPSDRFSR